MKKETPGWRLFCGTGKYWIVRYIIVCLLLELAIVNVSPVCIPRPLQTLVVVVNQGFAGLLCYCFDLALPGRQLGHK